MRRALLLLPLTGAAIGLLASFIWPWMMPGFCPSNYPGTCVFPFDSVRQHIQWTASGAVVGLVVALALIGVNRLRVSSRRGSAGDEGGALPGAAL